MVHQLLSTIKSLVWAILLLLLIIYLFAIVFTQAVTSIRMEEDALRTASEGGASSEMAAPRVSEEMDFSSPMMKYWSTLPRSMYSLYMSITGGISWGELSDPLSDVSGVYVALFAGYIILTQLAVLNVLTGVFCQNAIDSAQHDQDLVTQAMMAQKESYVNKIQEIFKSIDTDGSGTLTIQEFRRHLGSETIKAYFESLELDVSDVWTLFKLIDTDEGNMIDLDEFVTGCMRLKGAAKCIDVAGMNQEQKWMSKRLTRFMKRTEARLVELQTQMHVSETQVLAALGCSPSLAPEHLRLSIPEDDNAKVAA